MTSNEFVVFRKKIGKTQSQMAQLLGISVKAIHSYEQGWRSIPTHVERQILLLVTKLSQKTKKAVSFCWDIIDCPEERKTSCPAWEFQAGDLCWFINGTICNGTVLSKWKDKINVCKTCPVLSSLL